ncbi:procollagen C-endopeptidase enhancer 1-like [Branchiostoma floridae x Branchiostoma japonicum]
MACFGRYFLVGVLLNTPALYTAQCGGGAPLTLTEQGVKEFTTPNFPNGAYPVNARCSWLIQVTSGIINLEFSDFNLPNEFVFGNAPCANTKINVFDGPTTSSRQLGIYCENTPPPVVTSSTGTSMLVSFTGGAFPRNGQGFRATFTDIDSTTAVHMTSPPLTTPGKRDS